MSDNIWAKPVGYIMFVYKVKESLLESFCCSAKTNEVIPIDFMEVNSLDDIKYFETYTKYISTYSEFEFLTKEEESNLFLNEG